MQDLESRYHSDLLEHGFQEETQNESYNSVGRLYSVPKEMGQGVYWVYSQKDLYDIKIHDFYLYEDSSINFQAAAGCLAICYCASVSGEEIAPYRRLTAGCVKSFIGRNEPRIALIHKNIPVRSIDIEITSAYYDKYLKESFPNEDIDPHEVFCKTASADHFPDMIQLLRQVWSYRGEGIAVKLFYEGKVAEAVSLIINYNNHKKKTSSVKVSSADIRALEDAAAYINDHFNYEISVDQLSHITCMGRTKLKLAFKEIYGCTITEYIQQRRLSHAETLLTLTDFTIEQVSAAIGYNNAGRFAGMFKKSTGVYPAEYRKMAQKSTTDK